MTALSYSALKVSLSLSLSLPLSLLPATNACCIVLAAGPSAAKPFVRYQSIILFFSFLFFLPAGPLSSKTIRSIAEHKFFDGPLPVGVRKKKP